jgi:hypothetical protein
MIELKKEVDDLFSKFFGSEGWLPTSYYSFLIWPGKME